jgi:hypothetical protein
MQPVTEEPQPGNGWPFKRVDLARVERLSVEDRSFVEGRLLSEIEKCEAGAKLGSEPLGVRQV